MDRVVLTIIANLVYPAKCVPPLTDLAIFEPATAGSKIASKGKSRFVFNFVDDCHSRGHAIVNDWLLITECVISVQHHKRSTGYGGKLLRKKMDVHELKTSSLKLCQYFTSQSIWEYNNPVSVIGKAPKYLLYLYMRLGLLYCLLY